MRLIDADALIKQFNSYGCHVVYGEKTVKAIISRINMQPTVDVEEVIKRDEMTNITIHINGKEIAAQISDEAAAELLQEKKTGYERVEKGECYYIVLNNGFTPKRVDDRDSCDNTFYSTANYYSDEIIAENNARANKLMRQLRRWQALNDAPVDWTDRKNKYDINFDYGFHQLGFCNWSICRRPGVIYFSSKEKAEEAIEVFRDELTWYFTKYRQRLDEPGRKEAAHDKNG